MEREETGGAESALLSDKSQSQEWTRDQENQEQTVYLAKHMLGLCCCAGFLLAATSGGYSLVERTRFSLRWFLLMLVIGSRACGLQ